MSDGPSASDKGAELRCTHIIVLCPCRMVAPAISPRLVGRTPLSRGPRSTSLLSATRMAHWDHERTRQPGSRRGWMCGLWSVFVRPSWLLGFSRLCIGGKNPSESTLSCLALVPWRVAPSLPAGPLAHLRPTMGRVVHTRDRASVRVGAVWRRRSRAGDLESEAKTPAPASPLERSVQTNQRRWNDQRRCKSII